MATVNRALARHFALYRGDDLMGLCANQNHLVFEWRPPSGSVGRILFSVARKGAAAVCHFASDKLGLRYVKAAADEFVQFVFWLFPWCKMVLACVNKASVARLIQKIGFLWVADDDHGSVYAWVL